MRLMRAVHIPFAISAMAFAVNTQAQGMLEEVLVTAAKREQTLQEVPIAVSVVPAETIERAEIRDLLDLQSVVPSLRVSQLQNSTQTNFIIRGFGNGANNPGIEPSVAVFIDGVYRSRSQGRISDLPNIDRVEVLRGPQNTLFGKNASAGVIAVVTSKPSLDETTGHVEVGFGNFDQYNTRGYVTGPISDSVAYSIGGAYFQRDGYATNSLLGTKQSERDRYNLRGELYFVPSDDTDIRFIVDYDELDEICCFVGNLVDGPTGAATAFLAGGNQYDAEDPFTYNGRFNLDPRTRAENWGVQMNWTTDFDDFVFTSITGYRDSYADQPTGDVDYTGADLIGNNDYVTDIQTFTQEFRLDGSFERVDWSAGAFFFDEQIDYEVGLVFGSQWRDYAALLVDPTNPANGAATLDGLEAALGLAPGSFFETGTGVREFATQDNQTWSLFTQADFRVSDKLTATVGVAYLEDDKEVSLFQDNSDVFSQLGLNGADGALALTNFGIAGAFPTVFGLPFTPENVGLVTSTPAGAAGFQALTQGVAAAVAASDLNDPAQNPLLGLQAFQFLPQLLGIPNAYETGVSADDKFTYTLRLAYDVNENLNVYTSFATGYKATSWNLSRDSRPTAQEIAGITAAGGTLPNNLTVGTRQAGPEEAEVFEIGFKYRNDWGYINGTVFDQVIEGFQSNAFIGTGFVLTNAGEQSVQGAELDMMIQATDALRLGFSATYLDPIYDSFPASAFGDITGETPAGIPELAFSAQASYEFNIGGVDAYIQADYQFEDEVDLQEGGDINPANIALGAVGYRTREIGLLNATLGFNINDIEVRFWGRNLTNDEFVLVNFASVAQAGSFSGYPNQPRTYGANFRYRF